MVGGMESHGFSPDALILASGGTSLVTGHRFCDISDDGSQLMADSLPQESGNYPTKIGPGPRNRVLDLDRDILGGRRLTPCSCNVSF